MSLRDLRQSRSRPPSLGNLELYTDKRYAKESSRQRRPGLLLRLSTSNLFLLLAIFVACAFLAGHSLHKELPSAGTSLPELDTPRRLSRVTLEDPARNSQAAEQDTAIVHHKPRGQTHRRQRGQRLEVDGAVELCKGSSCGRAADSAGSGADKRGAGTVWGAMEQPPEQQQQPKEPSSGKSGGAVDTHQQQQQQQGEQVGGGSWAQQVRERHAKWEQEVQGAGGGAQLGAKLLEGGHLAVPRRPRRKKPRYTPGLKREVDELIQEAAEVAQLKGIATEADGGSMAGLPQEEEVGGEPGLLAAGTEGLLRAAERCTPDSCSPHGVCLDGRCHCVVAYTGKRCGHALLLSRPFLPEVMKSFSAGFEGEIVLHAGTKHKELKVYHPPKEGEPAGDKPYTVVADEATLQQLIPALPPRDEALKGTVYASCAVVGSSGSLLLYEKGSEIDAHEAVFRFNAAPSAGYEAHAGRKTTHRFTNLRSWGFAEGGEEVLVHTSAPAAVEGLLWNARQAAPWRVASLDPDFEDYAARAFAFAPTQGLYGLLAALHVCRRVVLYGFGLSQQHDVPQRYYDPCETLSNPQRAEQQATVVRALADAGLVELGEPCTLECLAGAAKCSACRVAAGVSLPAEWPACDAAARAQQEARRHVVPWMMQQQQQQQEAGGGGQQQGAVAQAGQQQQQQQEQEQQQPGEEQQRPAEQQAEAAGAAGAGGDGQAAAGAQTEAGAGSAKDGSGATAGGAAAGSDAGGAVVEAGGGTGDAAAGAAVS